MRSKYPFKLGGGLFGPPEKKLVVGYPLADQPPEMRTQKNPQQSNFMVPSGQT